MADTLPSSFDPAIDLHSELVQSHLPTPSDSDDFEALNTLQEETIASKTKQGIVIQHRAWKIADVFRSEDDYPLDTPCSKASRFINPLFQPCVSSDPPCPPSSPPAIGMSSISSPIAYPPSSSPPPIQEHRKRSRPADGFTPAKRRLVGGWEPPTTPAKEAIGVSNTGADLLASLTPQRSNEPIKRVLGPFVEDDVEDIQDPSVMAMFESMQEPATDSLSTVIPTGNLTYKKTYESVREPTNFIRTARGIRFPLRKKAIKTTIPYEQLIASRSKSVPGMAKTSFYGIEIHKLIDEAKITATQLPNKSAVSREEAPRPSVEEPAPNKCRKGRTMMWTEKYRAKRFTDLVGDERTHRSVLRWLKGWDPIVFPTASRPKPRSKPQEETAEDRPHRKILLLTGPPGLGKTTLAHVCARQAGYEVAEINASDERSREVVKGRIRDSVGTENVRGVNMKTTDGIVRKAGRPVCVVVDEVDGVVSGSSGGGEGGFIKALLDLVVLDQKNSKSAGLNSLHPTSTRKVKKGDQFRLLRPMILICNDVYHPALRPLRASNMAEIIHIRKPPLDKVVARLKTVFDKEGISSDNDGVRRLCEAAWGISNTRESRSNSSNSGEGDIRGVLVVGEWVARKIRGALTVTGSQPRLTKQWVEKHMLNDLAHGGGGSRGIGRGGAKEAVDRVFLDGAGFPKSIASLPLEDTIHGGTVKSIGVAELSKRTAMDRLREIIDTSGECDRIITDCFTTYPSHPFQDDTFLSKPNAAYEWLNFHDALSSRIFAGQEWELNPYLSQSILGFHYLFAAPAKNSWGTDQKNQWTGEQQEESSPFTGPRADFSAYEAEKANRSLLQQLQASLSVPLLRSFRSPEELATGLLPHLLKMLTPDVKPVIVGGSGEQRGTASVRKEAEREMVRRAVDAMSAVSVTFERSKVEDARGGFGGFVYRMEPPLDTLATFDTASQITSTSVPARYAIRQVLDQEYQKYLIRQRAEARQSRYTSGNSPPVESNFDTNPPNLDQENLGKSSAKSTGTGKKVAGVKRDFFGRIIVNEAKRGSTEAEGNGTANGKAKKGKEQGRVWVSYHEGFSNAVRKPIGLEELMKGM